MSTDAPEVPEADQAEEATDTQTEGMGEPAADAPPENAGDKKPAAPRVPTRAEAFEHVKGRIVALTPEVRAASLKHERLKEATKQAKTLWEGHAAELTHLCEELVQIEEGTWQPRLPFPVESEEKPKAKKRAKPVDPGTTAELSVLVGYGMTSKQVEKLQESQLASEGPLKTIADLEAAIRKDEWWHKKIKGFGESKRDALLDALVKYRSEFPVPSDEDDEDGSDENSDPAFPELDPESGEELPAEQGDGSVFAGTTE